MPPPPVVLVPPVPPPVEVSVDVAPPPPVVVPVVDDALLVLVVLVVLELELELELVTEPVLSVVPDVVVLGPVVVGFPLLPSEGSLHAIPVSHVMAMVQTCSEFVAKPRKRMTQTLDPKTRARTRIAVT